MAIRTPAAPALDPVQPWDDATMAADLIELVATLPRLPLADAIDVAPPIPGAYLQFVASDHREVTGVLGPVLSSARYPVYAGVAARNLRARVSRYRQSLRGVRAVGESDLHLTLVPCSSPASAVFAESVLLDHYRPVLSMLGGWGSKIPGARRSPKVSPVDALWPGRSWAPPASPAERAQALLAVVANLAAMDPAGHRWPSLGGSWSTPEASEVNGRPTALRVAVHVPVTPGR